MKKKTLLGISGIIYYIGFIALTSIAGLVALATATYSCDTVGLVLVVLFLALILLNSAEETVKEMDRLP